MANNGPINDKDSWRQLQEAAMKYEEYKQKAKLAQLTIPKDLFTGSTLPITSPLQRPGRPVGSKTKDKEVIIQETVDRLIDQVVKLLTKHNFDEDRLNDADITVDEKSNYAFITVTVGLPNGSIISVSERVKVANKTDPTKNWNSLNKGAYTGKRHPVEPVEDYDQ